MKSSLVLLPTLFAIIGCADESPVDSAPSGPTWYGDVEPIAMEKCGSCHDGAGVGTGNWTVPEEAAAAATLMAVEIEAARMPLPAADPGCRAYAGHEHMHLSDEEKALFLDWAAAGAPLGDIADRAADLSPPDLHLDDTDITLEMPFTHTLDVGDDGSEYFCMVLDNPLTEPRFITGIDVDLGNPEVVHHMLLAVDRNNNAGTGYGVSDPSEGFQCRSPVIETDWMLLHAWTPGMEPVEFPEGHGLELKPGEQLVLQMHYFADPDEPAVTDFSSYKLRTSDEIGTQVQLSVTGDERFNIPAGDGAYSYKAFADRNTSSRDYAILGAFPHMHLLGSGFRSWIEDGETGEEDCVVEGPYDFDHQMTYMFDEPAIWGSGDKLQFECTWDNSSENPAQFFDPPQDIGWGEGTTEEMCYLLFYVAPLRA